MIKVFTLFSKIILWALFVILPLSIITPSLGILYLVLIGDALEHTFPLASWPIALLLIFLSLYFIIAAEHFLEFSRVIARYIAKQSGFLCNITFYSIVIFPLLLLLFSTAFSVYRVSYYGLRYYGLWLKPVPALTMSIGISVFSVIFLAIRVFSKIDMEDRINGLSYLLVQKVTNLFDSPRKFLRGMLRPNFPMHNQVHKNVSIVKQDEAALAQVTNVEDELALLITRLGDPIEPKKLLQHIKAKRTMKRAGERVEALNEVLRQINEVLQQRLELEEKKNKIITHQVKGQSIEERVRSEELAEISKNYLLIAENLSKVQAILNPPKPQPKPPQKSEAEKRAEHEAEAKRRFAEEIVMRKELADLGYKGVDLDEELERRKRALGWYHNIK